MLKPCFPTPNTNSGLWHTLTIALILVSVFFVIGPAPVDWVYDRKGLANYEVWRLVTGHLVHSESSHLLWNVIALVMLGGFVEQHSVRLFWNTLLIGIIGVDSGLFFVLPDLQAYCGLSGVLNSLWLVTLILVWGETRQVWVILLAGISIAKLIIEMHTGKGLLTETQWPSIPEAHLFGFLAVLPSAMYLAFARPFHDITGDKS